MEEAELQALLAQSRAWNSAHGLTGLLLYCHGSIMQVLEGTEEEVGYIFNRIARDYRHTNVVKLADGPVADRSFSEWSMGFKTLHPEDFTRLSGYVNPKAQACLATASADAGLRAILADLVEEELIRF